jgi:hypothetical protein
MADGKRNLKRDQGEESFVDPVTGKTHVVKWTVEERSEQVPVDPARATIAATGVVALWKFLTYGAGMKWFRAVVISMPVVWALGWKSAMPNVVHPLANAVGAGFVWLVFSTGLIRVVRVNLVIDEDSEAGRRMVAVNTGGFFLCLFLASYLGYLIALNWLSPARPH